MKYNLANQQEKKEAWRYFTTLANKKQIVEVRRITGARTLPQNSYLHLILSAFAEHFGYTVSEAKLIYKREVNPDLYLYQRKGRQFLRSSSDLTKEEMATSIDRLHNASAAQGFPLPPATDQAWLRQIQNQIEREKVYL